MTTYKVYKNQPFNLRIFKDRYWDVTINKSISEDVAETVYLEPYDGVNAQINHNATAPLLFIDDGVLPDNSVFDATQGCLMPEGHDYLVSSRGYYDIPCSEGLKINYETGLAEGFSSADKISLGRCLEGTAYSLIQKAYFDGAAREQTIWLADGGKNVGIKDNKLGIYVSNWTFGESILESGIYWFQATYKDRIFKLYCLMDNDETYTLDTLPALEEWSEEVVIEDCDSPLASSSFVHISRNSASYWGGKMYLNGSCVRIMDENMILAFPQSRNEIYRGMLASGVSADGQAQNYNIFYKDRKFVADVVDAKVGYRWCGNVSMRAYDTSAVLRKCYTVVGTPAFSYPNLSGFSAGNYIITEKALPQGQFFPISLKIVCKCTPTNVTTNQILMGDDSANNHGFGIRYYDWRLCGESMVYGGQVEKGKTYWLQVIQESGVGTRLYYLPDDGTYTFDTLPAVEQWSTGPTTSEMIFDNSGKKIRIGTRFSTPKEYWIGSIDLLNTCIYSGMKTNNDAEIVWVEHWKPFA